MKFIFDLLINYEHEGEPFMWRYLTKVIFEIEFFVGLEVECMIEFVMNSQKYFWKF